MGSSGPGRVRVERGIYRQPNGKYAVCWRHAGRLRFRTVGFDLAEAPRERLALIAATCAGKVLVSPRLRFEAVAGWWLARFEAKVAAAERHARRLEARAGERSGLPVQTRVRWLTAESYGKRERGARRADLAAECAPRPKPVDSRGSGEESRLDLSSREFWALIHGIVLGGAFLVAFTGGLAGFYSLRPELVTAAGITERVRRLSIGTTVMAVITWLTVIVGTWVVYPWYREDIPDSPRSTLLANPDTKDWHEFAMEWKEHVAWIAPMLATAAAFLVLYYRADLVRNPLARRIAMGLFVLAFLCAVVAGVLGALITKKAPVT